MKIIFFLYIFIGLITNLSFGQQNKELTAYERAYLYHVVKKSPILNNEIGRYFDYKGSDIRLPDNEINFDSVELIIIKQPELLIIRNEEIAKSAKGILAETANKMALWELNKILHYARGNEKDFSDYKEKYLILESILMDTLPTTAKIQDDGQTILHPKTFSLLNPSLSLNDKIAIVESMRFMTNSDGLQTLNAINYSVNKYVENRSFEIFKLLGGEATTYLNYLVAAGDGSNTAGLLEEREKDEKGEWNKGLPKAIGLFPYQLKTSEADEIGSTKIIPLSAAITKMQTVGGNRYTNLHFDVWGYNSEKQTTVVVFKNGNSYPLFGSADTRFLSPDSTFGKGATFQSMINDLKNNKINPLKELIYGKSGFDDNLKEFYKLKEETEIELLEHEGEYMDMHRTPIYTKKKATKKAKQDRKKLEKNSNYMVKDDNENQPITISNKFKKGKKQNTIIDMYGYLEAINATIKDLEKQKSEASDLLNKYMNRLNHYQELLGTKWATFTVQDGLYTFEDSTTFDISTQEFKFPPSRIQEDFEVKLIAIPENSLSELSDEVMLHINLVDAIPNYDARLQIELEDVFSSDNWLLDRQLLGLKDSVAVLQFFEELLNKKKVFTIIARGQGVGMWDSCRVIKNLHPIELNAYPTSKMDDQFVRLRKSEVYIDLDKEIKMQVNSYTDPVKSNLEITKPEFIELLQKYKLTKNDLLSAYRTATILKKLKSEISILAGAYLSRENAKIVIDRFNIECNKVRISIGATSIKLTDLP